MHAGGFEVTSGSQARERQGDQGHGREGSCSPPCCTTSTSNSNNSNWWACLSSRSTARTNIHQMSNLGAVKVLCLGVRGDNKRCCLASWRSEFSNCQFKLAGSGGGSAHVHGCPPFTSLHWLGCKAHGGLASPSSGTRWSSCRTRR